MNGLTAATYDDGVGHNLHHYLSTEQYWWIVRRCYFIAARPKRNFFLVPLFFKNLDIPTFPYPVAQTVFTKIRIPFKDEVVCNNDDQAPWHWVCLLDAKSTGACGVHRDSWRHVRCRCRQGIHGFRQSKKSRARFWVWWCSNKYLQTWCRLNIECTFLIVVTVKFGMPLFQWRATKLVVCQWQGMSRLFWMEALLLFIQCFLNLCRIDERVSSIKLPISRYSSYTKPHCRAFVHSCCR